VKGTGAQRKGDGDQLASSETARYLHDRHRALQFGGTATERRGYKVEMALETRKLIILLNQLLKNPDFQPT